MLPFILAAASVLVAGVSLAAGEVAGRAEAKAMLQRVVAALQANKPFALQQITQGGAGFRDRGLYPFCGGADGRFSAHPKQVGQPLSNLQDASGQVIGAELYRVAQEGKVTEVPYLVPDPDGGPPLPKTALVTRVGEQVCAVLVAR
jgi:hypothetical protein